MRQQLGKYFFEVSVIFIGITLGFIFDEWRDQRTEQAKKKLVYQSIHAELLRTKTLLQKTDSSNSHLIVSLNEALKGKRFDSLEILQGLDLLTTDFHLNMESVLNTLRSLSEQNSIIFTNNPTISQNISYIYSIAADHSTLVSDLNSMAKNNIWPSLIAYHVLDDMIAYRSDSDRQTFNGDYTGLLRDLNFKNQLKLIILKRASLAIVYFTLIQDFDRILVELEKEL